MVVLVCPVETSPAGAVGGCVSGAVTVGSVPHTSAPLR